MHGLELDSNGGLGRWSDLLAEWCDSQAVISVLDVENHWTSALVTDLDVLGDIPGVNLNAHWYITKIKRISIKSAPDILWKNCTALEQSWSWISISNSECESFILSLWSSWSECDPDWHAAPLLDHSFSWFWPVEPIFVEAPRELSVRVSRIGEDNLFSHGHVGAFFRELESECVSAHVKGNWLSCGSEHETKWMAVDKVGDLLSKGTCLMGAENDLKAGFLSRRNDLVWVLAELELLMG